mmetsp:Transcript_57063/g.83473  ORF Transcript_57063/g.83473 Transcript_57063/m.83473 type:complete len:117 (+) Transcript_57063:274-624(+)
MSSLLQLHDDDDKSATVEWSYSIGGGWQHSLFLLPLLFFCGGLWGAAIEITTEQDKCPLWKCIVVVYIHSEDDISKIISTSCEEYTARETTTLLSGHYTLERLVVSSTTILILLRL